MSSPDAASTSEPASTSDAVSTSEPGSPSDAASTGDAASTSEPASTSDAASTSEPAGSFGDNRVDEAVAGLSGLDERDVHEHPAHYERAHGALRAALDDEPTAPSSSDTGSA